MRSTISFHDTRYHVMSFHTKPPIDSDISAKWQRSWTRLCRTWLESRLVSSAHEDHIRHFPDRKCARRRRWPGISHLNNSSFSVKWLRFHPVRSRKCPRNFHLAILHDFSLESRHTVLPERLRDRYFMCRFIYIDDAVEKMLNCLMVNLLNQCREQRNRASAKIFMKYILVLEYFYPEFWFYWIWDVFSFFKIRHS